MDQQKLINLISDIERLRTFYQLAWIMFTKGTEDIGATKWRGETADVPDSLSPAIAASSNSMQQMWKSIVPYVEKQLPSEKQFETAYRQKLNAAIQREYPAVDRR